MFCFILSLHYIFCQQLQFLVSQKTSTGMFQHLNTLKDFKWMTLIVKTYLFDTFTLKESSCASKSYWALVQMCACKIVLKRSNIYASDKFFLNIHYSWDIANVPSNFCPKQANEKDWSPPFFQIFETYYCYPILQDKIGPSVHSFIL